MRTPILRVHGRTPVSELSKIAIEEQNCFWHNIDWVWPEIYKHGARIKPYAMRSKFGTLRMESRTASSWQNAFEMPCSACYEAIRESRPYRSESLLHLVTQYALLVAKEIRNMSCYVSGPIELFKPWGAPIYFQIQKKNSHLE